MTTPAVTFSYPAWVARYPELANVSEPYAQLCFNEATLYCANVLGIVCNPDTLSALLNMLTAHIVKLYSAQTNGQPDSAGSSANPGVVGRVSAATEGSVNVTLEMPNQPAAAAWYLQTSYGASFWAATAVYRTARYVPGDPMRPAFPAGGPYASPYFPWGGRW